MYTFQPLIDNSSSHFTFWVMLVLGIIFLLYIWRERRGNRFTAATTISATFVAVMFLILSGVVSFTPDHPINKRVIGTFVSFQPEGYQDYVGKSMAEHHYMHVVYSINGQYVILPAAVGQVYPRYAFLYKN